MTAVLQFEISIFLSKYLISEFNILALTKNDTTSCELFNSLDVCKSGHKCDVSSGQPLCM